MHSELSPFIVWIALWIMNTYFEFQVNICYNNRDITKCQSFSTMTTTTTPKLLQYLEFSPKTFKVKMFIRLGSYFQNPDMTKDANVQQILLKIVSVLKNDKKSCKKYASDSFEMQKLENSKSYIGNNIYTSVILGVEKCIETKN